MRSLRADVRESMCVCVCTTHIAYTDAVQLTCKRNNHFPLLELSQIDLFPCLKFKMLALQPRQYYTRMGKPQQGL